MSFLVQELDFLYRFSKSLLHLESLDMFYDQLSTMLVPYLGIESYSMFVWDMENGVWVFLGGNTAQDPNHHASLLYSRLNKGSYVFHEACCSGLLTSYLPVLLMLNGNDLTEQSSEVLTEIFELLGWGFDRTVRLNHITNLASRDALTDVYNRTYFYWALHEKLEMAKSHALVSLLMCDVDHFKAINDTFGHVVGDMALKGVASALSQLSRTEDIVCRYGGEEFIIMLDGCDVGHAVSVAEKIRAYFDNLSLYFVKVTDDKGCYSLSLVELDDANKVKLWGFSNGSGAVHSQLQVVEQFNRMHVDDIGAKEGWDVRPLKLTISIGVSGFPDSFTASRHSSKLIKDAETSEEDMLIYMADKALYQAKKEGRNQVQVYTPR